MTPEPSPSPPSPASSSNGEASSPAIRTRPERSTVVFVLVSVAFSTTLFVEYHSEEPALIDALGPSAVGGLLLYWALAALRRRRRAKKGQDTAAAQPKGWLARVMDEEAAAARERKQEARERARTRIHTPTEAETFVAKWLRSQGFRSVRATPPSSDAGIDVTASGISVQVKRYASKGVGRPEVQQLVGAARVGDVAVFFTSSRYTDAAVEYADQRGAALFAFDFAGGYPVRVVNRTAKRLLRDGGHGHK